MVRSTLIDGITPEYRFGNDRRTWQIPLHCHSRCMQMIVVNRIFAVFVLLDIEPENGENLILRNEKCL